MRKEDYVICSACLLGLTCRYDGKSKPNNKVIELFKQGNLIPVCPEQMGGLPTPREPAEPTGNGCNVLDGKAKVLTATGIDITKRFIFGAEQVLELAKILNIKKAILKQRSPSCGCGQIKDGTFSDTIVEGDGITTALLKRNGLEVITEEDF